MVTRSETPDLAVDELKRRARRRLVGAIVLALAAAVLLPLLLESEPKPLGDEVSIQIPPIDAGKFVNPLSPGKSAEPKGRSGDAGAKGVAPAGAAGAPTETPPAGASAPAPSGAASEQPAAAGAPAAVPPAAVPPANAPATPANPETKSGGEIKPIAPGTEPSGAAPSVAVAKPEAPAQVRTVPNADAQPVPAQSGGEFVVQVAAFTDRYGALALARKLKRAGFPGYTESVATDKGELHRVRIGPYPSRDAADAARAKLKAAGYDAIVARAR